MGLLDVKDKSAKNVLRRMDTGSVKDQSKRRKERLISMMVRGGGKGRLVIGGKPIDLSTELKAMMEEEE